MKRINEGIYLSDFSSIDKILNRKLNRLKKNFGFCFGLLWYIEFEKAVKTTRSVWRAKQEWLGMSGELGGTQGDFTTECMEDFEVAVTSVTHQESKRSTLCCPVFQSPLLFYLFRSTSGKWSAYNFKCSTSH